eukprot:Gregarina_sp_Poly_1__11306@NODE_944_length_5611_cov_11_583514_g669_i0_p3_GENE_NODE_944_length_5611_cov_11_583514_g669_i0NODE_944_length_5611_cov_11_583514_g669_i0_p3_ORF_typecomplete_len143_score8_71_NODE_944_length_5611_cov_11_583514_g669_i09631391
MLVASFYQYSWADPTDNFLGALSKLYDIRPFVETVSAYRSTIHAYLDSHKEFLEFRCNSFTSLFIKFVIFELAFPATPFQCGKLARTDPAIYTSNVASQHFFIIKLLCFRISLSILLHKTVIFQAFSCLNNFCILQKVVPLI